MQRFLQLGGQTKDQESRIEEFALEVAKGEINPDNSNLGNHDERYKKFGLSGEAEKFMNIFSKFF